MEVIIEEKKETLFSLEYWINQEKIETIISKGNKKLCTFTMIKLTTGLFKDRYKLGKFKITKI